MRHEHVIILKVTRKSSVYHSYKVSEESAVSRKKAGFLLFKSRFRDSLTPKRGRLALYATANITNNTTSITILYFDLALFDARRLVYLRHWIRLFCWAKFGKREKTSSKYPNFRTKYLVKCVLKLLAERGCGFWLN